MDKSQRKSKKGFTLIELIVVMVLLGIISSVVMMLFQFNNTSFKYSNKYAFFQEDARQALRDVELYLGVASRVELYNSVSAIPTPPYNTNYSYCYFDTNHKLVFYNATTKRLIHYFTEQNTEITVEFYPIAPVAPVAPDVLADLTMIRIVIKMDSLEVTSDVAIQNLSTTQDNINDKRTDKSVSAKYIEFSQP